uniref:Uncharacterized protein n=1 Tax=Anopheles albimanus TaxID=7167 RepID=A0A182FX55_ANOAL
HTSIIALFRLFLEQTPNSGKTWWRFVRAKSCIKACQLSGRAFYVLANGLASVTVCLQRQSVCGKGEAKASQVKVQLAKAAKTKA